MAGIFSTRRKRWLIGILATLLAIGLAEYWLYPLFMSAEGPSHDKGANGLWIRYKWYFGEEKDFKSLAARLNNGRFRYAFFHVRFVDKDGSLHFRYPKQARELNRHIKILAPTTKRIAWIFAGNEAIDGNVNLGNAAVRKKMVEEALWLVQECGFDGVQWDYEICPDGDQSLLRLLEETNEALPATYVSVAVPSAYSWPFTGLGWSEDYYIEVARRCDQMAVMGYDTGAYFPRWYVRHLQASTQIIGGAVKGTACKVLMGLPTYEDGPPSHNQRTENLRLALAAMKGVDLPNSVEGIALFADYTTDEDEWRDYMKYWVRPK